MTKPDPTIDEVRQARHVISASFNHDPRKLVEYYRELQKRHQERVLVACAPAPEKKADDAA